MTTITQEPREIAFDAIRKGDDIEVVWERDDRTDTMRGIADYQDPAGWWRTSQGRVLAGPIPAANRAIRLHHRPDLSEPEGLGAVIRTDVGIEYVSVNRQPGTPRWVVAMIADRDRVERWAIRWAEFDLDRVDVLSEGNEEES